MGLVSQEAVFSKVSCSVWDVGAPCGVYHHLISRDRCHDEQMCGYKGLGWNQTLREAVHNESVCKAFVGTGPGFSRVLTLKKGWQWADGLEAGMFCACSKVMPRYFSKQSCLVVCGWIGSSFWDLISSLTSLPILMCDLNTVFFWSILCLDCCFLPYPNPLIFIVSFFFLQGPDWTSYSP